MAFRLHLVVIFLCSVINIIPTSVSGLQVMDPANPYIIESYTTDDGLPVNTMSDLLYARDGYLYVGTASGMVRMDGIHIDVFNRQNTKGLHSNRISRMFNLSDETLVLSDYQHRLYIFKDGKAKSILHPTDSTQIKTPIVREFNDNTNFILDSSNGYLLSEDTLKTVITSIPNYEVWDGYFTPDSALYLLNSNGLYLVQDRSAEQLPLPKSYLPDLSSYARLEVIDDHIFIIGSGNIACWNKDTGTPCPSHSHNLSSDTNVRHIKKTTSENFLIGTTTGFYEYKNNSLQHILPSTKALYYESIFELPNGEKLIVTSNKVIADNKVIFRSPSTIIDATIDDQKGLWVTTSNNGLMHIQKNSFTNYTDSTITNSYAIVETQTHSKYIGSFLNGFARWDDTGLTSFNNNNSILDNNTNRMIHGLQNGTVLIAEWGESPYVLHGDSLKQINELDHLFKNGTNVLEGFFEDNLGRWWLGTKDGLYIKDHNRIQPFYDSKNQTIQHVNKIIPSPFNDDLFFCSDGDGVVMLRDSTFHFLSASLPQSAPHIRDLHFQSSDTIWAASYNSGIHRYLLNNESVEAQVLGNEEGIKQVGFHRIIEDQKGYYWISSNKGLLKVSSQGLSSSADQGKVMTNLQWFYAKDGLFEEEFNGGSQNTGLIDHKGKIWFPHIEGVTSFNPLDFKNEPIDSIDIRLQKLITAKRTVDLYNSENLRLDKDERTFKLRIAHLGLSNNFTEQLWYRIPEINGDWSNVEEDGWLSFDYIPEGNLNLQLTNNPVSAANTVSFSINAQPKLYEQTAFQLLAGGMAAAIALLLYRLYPKRGKQEKDIQSHGSPPESTKNGYDLSSRLETEPASVQSPVPEANGICEQQWLEQVKFLENFSQKSINLITAPLANDPIRIAIHKNFKDPDFTIPKLTQILNTSKATLYRNWSAKSEISIVKYTTHLRMIYAVHLILNKKYTISDAAYNSGFNSPSYFAKVFKKELGQPPSDFIEEYS